jgi:hypothetical protein
VWRSPENAALPPRTKYFAAVWHLDHFARRPGDAEKISQVRAEPFGMGKKPMRFAIFDNIIKIVVTMAHRFRIGP